MWSYPALEPVVVENATFTVERVLDRDSEVLIGVGERVTAQTVVARSNGSEKMITLYAASELGVEPGEVKKFLTKSVGGSVDSGEVVARVRKGLRSTTVRSPLAGTLSAVDETAGTIGIQVSVGRFELRSLVEGEVTHVVAGRGTVIEAHGTRVFGILGFGTEAIGNLVVGVDRADRELTPDLVDPSWTGQVVLAGMTVGVPALRRLEEVRVAGVIVGSLAEAEIRRFLGSASGDVTPSDFWGTANVTSAAFGRPKRECPFAVVVTEGFGRQPIAEPVFEALAKRDGTNVSLNATTAVGRTLARPEIYIGGIGAASQPVPTAQLVPGRLVRVLDPVNPGLVGQCETEASLVRRSEGHSEEAITVRGGAGAQHLVPTSNVEVLV